MCEILDNAFKNLEQIFKEVHEIKKSNGNDDEKSELINGRRKTASLMLVLIKKYNRIVKHRVRARREKLHREKLLADSNWLQFQNLLYEVSHLKREIRHCIQFKSQDEDIQLLTLEEYQKLTPGENHAPRSIPDTEHGRRLQLLESELKLRKHLSEYYDDLYVDKRTISGEIVKILDRLTSVQPQIALLLEASKPLQDALEMPLIKKWEVDRLVRMLPAPFYLIYMNIFALKSTFDPQITLEIIGSEEDLTAVEEPSSVAHFERKSSSNQSLADAVDDEEMENERKRYLTPETLGFRLTIANAPNSNEYISVEFKYFQHLALATASASITLSANDGTISELISPQMILNNIFDDDFGDTVPVFSTIYKLNKLKISVDELLEHLSSNNLGKPYRWLQEICCFDTCNTTKNDRLLNKIQKMALCVIKRIKKLWNARLNLLNQIKALTSKNIDMYIVDENLPQTMPTCSLVQWTAVTRDEYASNSATAQYNNVDLLNDSYVFYRAVVVRGSAKMECLVSISNKFPEESPLWTIYIHWNGEHNSINNAAIKQMEHWTNILKQSDLKSDFALLSMQLLRTMYSFDIFLETESQFYSPSEFCKEKHFVKAFRRRNRERPFSFIGGGTKNLFKQL